MKKLFGLLVLTAAVLALTAFRPHRSTTPAIVDWPSEPMEFGAISETVSATGTVQPRDLVPVGSDAAGRLLRVFVEPNQVVKTGDPLAQFDDRLALLRLQQARIGVELALADVQRAEAARDAAMLAWQKARDTAGQLNPRGDADQADLQRKVAEAALKAVQIKVRETQSTQQLAELAVDMTIVRAPMQGIVLEKRVTPGQQLGPPLTAHMFSMARDLEHMQVSALVAEADLPRVRIGQPSKLTVNAWPDEPMTGQVTRIGNIPQMAAGAVQYPVTVDLTNIRTPSTKESKLRPGLTAAVDFVVRSHDRVWKLPIAAAAVVIDEAVIDANAKAKLARWQARHDRGDWQCVWLLDTHHRPRPIFLRIGGATSQGDPGITDGQFHEVLAWDPEEPTPNASSPPRVVTSVPDAAKPKPGLKLF